ncbi:MAG: MlaD family protein [Alphaproteobacteria bacterium]|jgi:phospholipid/cholesterol/gamma-HCH transport system substrate-binding protein|nr:MlaD family protein [Alphaproteobacteria bacterium]
MKNRTLEFIFGIAIIAITAVFFVYVLLITLNNTFKTYTLNATFNNIGSLTTGAKVLINGFEVGNVGEIKLLPNTYKIQVVMNINKGVDIPKDSVLSIQAAGFFDAPSLAFRPGNSSQFFKANEMVSDTRDWVSLEDKIGDIFFSITNN